MSIKVIPGEPLRLGERAVEEAAKREEARVADLHESEKLDEMEEQKRKFASFASHYGMSSESLLERLQTTVGSVKHGKTINMLRRERHEHFDLVLPVWHEYWSMKSVFLQRQGGYVHYAKKSGGVGHRRW